MSPIFLLAILIFNNEISAITIGLVDYRPLLSVEENTRKYLNIIEEVFKNGESLDVLVFPHETLLYSLPVHEIFNYTSNTRLTQEPENPCYHEWSQYPQFVKDLSCAASQHGLTLVADAPERVPCNEFEIQNPNDYRNCRKFQWLFYDTTVLLDSNGTVVLREHPDRFTLGYFYDYVEVTFRNVLLEGERYGILFSNSFAVPSPVQDFVENHRTGSFFYTSSRTPELPFLSGGQALQMFAQGYDVNVFAASTNLDESGSGGTGFYRGVAGAIRSKRTVTYEDSSVYIFDPATSEPETPLTDQEIDTLAKSKDSLNFKVDSDLLEYTSELLDLENTELTTKEICDQNTCCEFTTKISNKEAKNFYSYRLVAWRGFHNFTESLQTQIEVCGIIACLNSSLSSCGRRFTNYDEVEWKTTFETILVKASSDYSKAFYPPVFFPNSLLSSISPISPQLTEWSVNEEERWARFDLVQPQSRVLTFAIYRIDFEERVYDNDYNRRSDEDDDGDNGDNNKTTKITTTTEKITTTPKTNGSLQSNFSFLIILPVTFIFCGILR